MVTYRYRYRDVVFAEFSDDFNCCFHFIKFEPCATFV